MRFYNLTLWRICRTYSGHISSDPNDIMRGGIEHNNNTFPLYYMQWFMQQVLQSHTILFLDRAHTFFYLCVEPYILITCSFNVNIDSINDSRVKNHFDLVWHQEFHEFNMVIMISHNLDGFVYNKEITSLLDLLLRVMINYM